MFGITRAFKRLAQQAALGGAAGVLLLAGVGFLTAAAYIALADLFDPVRASLIIGGVLTGFGLVLLSVMGGDSARSSSTRTVDRGDDASRQSDTPARHWLVDLDTQDGDASALADAFITGFQEGAATRQSH